MRMPLGRIGSLAGQLTYSCMAGRSGPSQGFTNILLQVKRKGDIAQFPLDEMPRLGQSRDSEETRGCQGLKEGKMGVTANGCGLSLWLDEK